MISWISIALMLFLGISLLIIEIIFIPGTTLVGILGLIFMVGGIATTYSVFGIFAGNVVLMVSLVSGGLATWVALKSGLWKKLALKDTLQGKANVAVNEKVKVGDIGKTLSMLRPFGKVEFESGIFEAHSPLELIKNNIEVRVSKIEDNKIIVTPLN
jgi:membrane-bound ClpP family serine protease